MTTLVRRRADPALAGRLQGSVSPFAGDVVVGPDGFDSDTYAIVDPMGSPCFAEGCELSGPHELHRDSEDFQWRQDVRAWEQAQ